MLKNKQCTDRVPFLMISSRGLNIHVAIPFDFSGMVPGITEEE
jgi:hypothetical protein